MSRPARQRAKVAAALAAVLVLGLVAHVAGHAVALQLAPGVLLLAAAVAGVLPGESAFVGAIRRAVRRLARSRRDGTTRPSRTSGAPRHVVVGAVSPRGPPRPVGT